MTHMYRRAHTRARYRRKTGCAATADAIGRRSQPNSTDTSGCCVAMPIDDCSACPHRRPLPRTWHAPRRQALRLRTQCRQSCWKAAREKSAAMACDLNCVYQSHSDPAQTRTSHDDCGQQLLTTSPSLRRGAAPPAEETSASARREVPSSTPVGTAGVATPPQLGKTGRTDPTNVALVGHSGYDRLTCGHCGSCRTSLSRRRTQPLCHSTAGL